MSCPSAIHSLMDVNGELYFLLDPFTDSKLFNVPEYLCHCIFLQFLALLWPSNWSFSKSHLLARVAVVLNKDNLYMHVLEARQDKILVNLSLAVGVITLSIGPSCDRSEGSVGL